MLVLIKINVINDKEKIHTIGKVKMEEKPYHVICIC
jgi:hypothetical protein